MGAYPRDFSIVTLLGIGYSKFMAALKLKEQVELIRQVFGYVNQFKGKSFVINIDSRVILSPLFPILVRDLVLLHRLGINIVLVPGAKVRIDEVLTKYQIPWEYREGVRISAPESIPFIKMAAFDVSNSLMTLLAENKTDAIIGNWVRARGIGVRDGVDFQCAGTVDRIKIDIIKSVLNQNLIPIFPNIGWSARGKPYNISSLELAATLSQELLAEKLFFITGESLQSIASYTLPTGVESNKDGMVSRFTVEEAKEFLSLNSKRSGDEQINLLSLACASCERGVRRVHIIEGNLEGVMLKEIFSSRGFGTMIYADEYSNIRPMVYNDIPEVLRMMEPLVEREILIPRTHGMLEEQCDSFVVYEVDGILHACGALRSYSGNRGEIAGLAVDETYASMGIGKKIVSFLLEKARRQGMEQVFVLTTQTSDWFSDLGFYEGTKEQLPREKHANYDIKRNSVVLCYDLKASPGTG